MGNPRTAVFAPVWGPGLRCCRMSEQTLSVIVAFDRVVTSSDYSAAKRMAGRLPRFDQHCIVDSMRAACKRVRANEARGVL